MKYTRLAVCLIGILATLAVAPAVGAQEPVVVQVTPLELSLAVGASSALGGDIALARNADARSTRTSCPAFAGGGNEARRPIRQCGRFMVSRILRSCE